MKRYVRASSTTGDYEVTVSFAGLSGAEESYTVWADSEDEAIDLAIEEAKDDLEVLEARYTGDETWEVEVGFASLRGVSNNYDVSGDPSEYDEACEAALVEAEWDLEGEIASFEPDED